MGLLNIQSVLLYIDPAATSVLISSITAIAVALGASFIIFWRKFKKKVSKTLKIDENAGKEVEEDLVITKDDNTDKKSSKDKKTSTKDNSSITTKTKSNINNKNK